MNIEDTIRQAVREEVRAAVREELRAALEGSKPVTSSESPLLTVEQVAQRAGGVKPETVRGWIRSGRLEAKRAGHRFLITSRALESFLVGGAAPKQETIDGDDHLSILMGRIEGKAVKRNKR